MGTKQSILENNLNNQFFLSNKLLTPVILVSLILLLGFNSFAVLTPGQAGVISVLGKARDGVLLEGIHFKPPLISVVDIYDLTVQKFEVPAESSTKDLQDLSARFAINFRLDPLLVVEIREPKGP
jgi:regulator of protease activity HflC (stomatin/prohibitin superfamily)